MNTIKNITILIIISFCVQGCLAPRVITPPIEGKVIDKNTKAPIINASVYFKEYPLNITKTGISGEFSLQEHKELRPFLIGDPEPPWVTLIIKKKDCIEYSIKTGGYIEQDIEIECKEDANR
jgi:hypothetical protein